MSGLNHTYNKTNIIASWQSDIGYYYPLIDRGNGWGAVNLMGIGRYSRVEDFAPSISASYLFKKIMNEAGYTVSGSFINSDNFKNCVIPSTTGVIVNDNIDPLSKSFYVGKNTTQTISNPSQLNGVAFSTSLQFNDETTAPFSDTNNLWNDVFYTNGSTTIKQRFTVGIEAIQSLNITNNAFNDTLYCTFYRQFDPLTYNETTDTATQHSTWAAGEGYAIPYNNFWQGAVIINQYNSTASALPDDSIQKLKLPYNGADLQAIRFQFTTDFLDFRNSDLRWLPLLPGEKVRVKVQYTPYNLFGVNSGSSLIFTTNCYCYNEVSKDIIQSMTMPMQAALPKNIKCKDYVLGIINMFNLYFEMDKENEKNIRIETKDVYYSGGKTIDWSSKIDLNHEIQESILGESQPKKLSFVWKDDKDYYNAFFKNLYNDNYGNVQYVLDNQFNTTEKKIESIFSPTPIVRLAHADPTINFIIPVIAEKIPDSGTERPSGAIDTNIRIMMRNKVTLPFNYNFAFENVNYSYYPYAGHLNHPYTPSFDLNWGVPSMTFFPIQTPAYNPFFSYPYQNLTWTYWQSYLREASDQDCKVLSVTMRLSSYDINNFDFRDKIYINTVSSTGMNAGYYHINKIEGWQGSTAKVELIKITNK